MAHLCNLGLTLCQEAADPFLGGDPCGLTTPPYIPPSSRSTWARETSWITWTGWTLWVSGAWGGCQGGEGDLGWQRGCLGAARKGWGGPDHMEGLLGGI